MDCIGRGRERVTTATEGGWTDGGRPTRPSEAVDASERMCESAWVGEMSK